MGHYMQRPAPVGRMENPCVLVATPSGGEGGVHPARVGGVDETAHQADQNGAHIRTWTSSGQRRSRPSVAIRSTRTDATIDAQSKDGADSRFCPLVLCHINTQLPVSLFLGIRREEGRNGRPLSGCPGNSYTVHSVRSCGTSIVRHRGDCPFQPSYMGGSILAIAQPKSALVAATVHASWSLRTFGSIKRQHSAHVYLLYGPA